MDPTSTVASTATTGALDDGGAVGTAFEWMVTQAVSMIDLVTVNPVLCLGLAIWAVGATIGLFKRLV